MSALFLQASRNKWRFNSPKGINSLSVEDLWDIPLQSDTGKANLDDVAKGLDRALRDSSEAVSFVAPTTPRNNETQAKFDLVREVIAVRVAENNAARDALERKQKRQKILEVIAAKEDKALEGQSLEDLKKMVEQLA